MAVLAFNEDFKLRGDGDAENGRTVTRFFKAETEGTVADFYALYTHANMPALGSQFPGVSNLVARRHEINASSDDLCHFKIEVTYEPAEGGSLSGTITDPERPWQDPPVVEYDFHPVRVNVDQCFHAWVGQGGDLEQGPSDEAEHAIHNSAYVPFSEGLVDEDYLMGLIIQRAERSVSPSELRKFQGTLNSDEVTVAGIVIGKHEGRLRKIKARKRFTPEGVEYYDYTYEILINFHTHLHRVLDAGFVQYDGASTYTPITDDDGNEVKEPWPLDGGGQPLRPYETDHVFAKFRTTREQPWQDLNLPVNAE